MKWHGFSADWLHSIDWVGASMDLRDNLLRLGFPCVEAVHLAFGLPYDEEREL